MRESPAIELYQYWLTHLKHYAPHALRRFDQWVESQFFEGLPMSTKTWEALEDKSISENYHFSSSKAELDYRTYIYICGASNVHLLEDPLDRSAEDFKPILMMMTRYWGDMFQLWPDGSFQFYRTPYQTPKAFAKHTFLKYSWGISGNRRFWIADYPETGFSQEYANINPKLDARDPILYLENKTLEKYERYHLTNYNRYAPEGHRFTYNQWLFDAEEWDASKVLAASYQRALARYERYRQASEKIDRQKRDAAQPVIHVPGRGRLTDAAAVEEFAQYFLTFRWSGQAQGGHENASNTMGSSTLDQ